jgi:RNA binding exosome subunit
MKYAHNIEMRVFSKEEDDEELIVETIKKLFPFDFEKEKIEFKSKISYGFEDKKIKILSVFVKKERHTTAVLKNMMKNLEQEQKDMLLKQLNSRLDESLHFYFRLDKEKLLNDEYFITDSGNCFRFKISIAAYPHKREVAKKIVNEILGL